MKTVKVESFFKPANAPLDLVKWNTTISDMFKSVKNQKANRAVFVVDKDDKLIGVIDIQTILKMFAWPIVKQESLTSFHEVSARTAEDIMVRPVSCKLSDDYAAVLKTMVESKLEDLPVVDDFGKVLGSVSCFDVLGQLVE